MECLAPLASVGIFLIILFVSFILPIIISMIKIINQYERGIRLRLGKYRGVVEGPGLVILIPFIDKMIVVDTRETPMNLPSQEVITSDNITIKVSAVVYFQVIEPDMAVLRNQDYITSIFQIAQTTLRNVVGQSELDEILQQRERINEKIRDIVDENTKRWGVKITLVEIKDIELPESLQKAMAKQAEAERERRAKIISAEAEYQAAQKLVEAANLIASQPVALQLRLFQLLADIASKGSNLVIPLPTELFKFFGNYEKPKQVD
ncbi:MAG: slipin family protein [Candidatus Calescibacterium sp.]|nr:slipin family protein [Candidatus Calescibacterium sp.]MCX7972180.1 slipin family protein [bacterium]MDW8194870.1 slipin family protein [Candidatus Calescibacterium sp.]